MRKTLNLLKWPLSSENKTCLCNGEMISASLTLRLFHWISKEFMYSAWACTMFQSPLESSNCLHPRQGRWIGIDYTSPGFFRTSFEKINCWKCQKVRHEELYPVTLSFHGVVCIWFQFLKGKVNLMQVSKRRMELFESRWWLFLWSTSLRKNMEKLPA